MANKAKKPVHEIRLGRIKAAIWANETDRGIRHAVQFVKLYRKDDEWQSTQSFDRDDLPVLEKVSDMAFRWIALEGRDESEHQEAA